MSKKGTKPFNVGAVVTSWVEVEIQANSLKEAMERASTLTADDFVTVEGSVVDQSMRVIQVADTDLSVQF